MDKQDKHCIISTAVNRRKWTHLMHTRQKSRSAACMHSDYFKQTMADHCATVGHCSTVIPLSNAFKFVLVFVFLLGWLYSILNRCFAFP